MCPTQLLLISLLATTSSATWAADGSERPEQVREVFLASQEQIHGETNQETAATGGTGKAPLDASAPTTAEEEI